MFARIIIGADLVPTQSNYEYFRKADIDSLIGEELIKLLSNANFSLFNLEVPLTDKEMPIEKCGPNLIAPIYTINGLQAINPYFFTLANNHILDQGESGLTSTMQVLKDAEIKYNGAGKNLANASEAHIEEINGIKVGIYCCVEHEFTIASENLPGANPFDFLESFEHVSELTRKSDYVIVLYHGGKEHYRYPSPMLQKVCRKFVEKGANLVVCQHSHCIGAEEDWNGGKIVYGQGNFLFDHSESEYWQTGLLINLEIEKHVFEEKTNVEREISYIPIRKKNEFVRLATNIDGRKILSDFFSRSREILVPGVIEQKYQEFADSVIEDYLSAFSGINKKNFMYRLLNKMSGYQFYKWHMRQKYKRRDSLVLRNFIECEAHRELLLHGLYTFDSNERKKLI